MDTIINPSVNNGQDWGTVDLKLPVKETAQRGLLVTATALSILSVIPPFRLAASTAARAIALISLAISCTDDISKTSLLMRIAKCAIPVLGIAALALTSPIVIVASIAADVGIQTIETLKALYNRDWNKASLHFNILVIDSLALAAVVTGGWQLMVAAAAASSCFMLAIFVKTARNAKSAGDVVDAVCYAAMAGAGIASAISAYQITRKYKTITQYPVKIASESWTKYTYYRGKIVSQETIVWKEAYEMHTRIEDATCVVKAPLDIVHYPTVPLAGTVIVHPESTSKTAKAA